MNLERKAFSYNFTLGPEWQQQVVDYLGANLNQDKILSFPSHIADGSTIFLEVLPGLSVLLLDMTFKVPVAITRIATDQQFYMVYFDMGDEITTHLLYGTAHRTGYHSKLGMSFMDAGTKGVIMPPVGERSYNLRLLVDKSFLQHIFLSEGRQGISGALFDETKNTLFFYSHIDSRSKVLLNALKDNDFADPTFELKLKSTALFLLGYLVERALSIEPVINRLADHDIDKIVDSGNYLLNNLLSDFPGQDFLAKRAEMSVSKYKILFRKIHKNTAQVFFSVEKLELAHTLLRSGNFGSITEVAYELSYTSPGYFSALFKKKFGLSPGKVLISNRLN